MRPACPTVHPLPPFCAPHVTHRGLVRQNEKRPTARLHMHICSMRAHMAHMGRCGIRVPRPRGLVRMIGSEEASATKGDKVLGSSPEEQRRALFGRGSTRADSQPPYGAMWSGMRCVSCAEACRPLPHAARSDWPAAPADRRYFRTAGVALDLDGHFAESPVKRRGGQRSTADAAGCIDGAALTWSVSVAACLGQMRSRARASAAQG